MKKLIAMLFTLLLALSLVTVGFASQNYSSDVVLIVGGDTDPGGSGGGGGGTTDPSNPGGGDDKDPGNPGGGDDKDPGNPGGGDDKDPGNPGGGDDKDPGNPGGGDDKDPGKPNPGRPNRPSGGGSGGGGSRPSSKPSKPSQNPNENKTRGDKPGGVDGDGKSYYLISGVHVDKNFKEDGYMYGFKQFVFGAEEYLTRAQFAAIMDRVFVFDNQKTTKSFEDTRGHWAEDHINRLASNGIILGVSDVEFRPNDALTRGHVLLMLTRVLDTANYSKVAKWDSVKSYHASETVARLLNSGIYDSMDRDYDINARITRGEMVHLMNNIIYGRDIHDRETEDFIRNHGVYRDLTGWTGYAYYDDCVKALNDPFVESEVARYA